MTEASASDSIAALRKLAEEALGQQSPERGELSPDAIQFDLLHELQVHQIELELQNEELRRVQAALEVARDRYLDLYDFAPVGYLVLNEVGEILQANLTAATLLGVARASLVRQLLSNFILNDDQDIYYLHRRQLFATGEPQVWEIRMVRKDGVQVWARITATVAADREGQAVCRAAISDITESKRLAAKVNFQATLLDAVGQAVVATDLDGNILYLNRAAEKLYGWPVAEALGRNVGEVTAPLLTDAQAAEIMRRRTAGESWSGEFVLQRRDGAAFPAMIHVSPVVHESGKRVGMIGVSHDISERKRDEDTLRRSLTQTARAQSMLIALGQAAQAVQRARTPQETYQTIGAELFKLGIFGGILTLNAERTHLAISHAWHDARLLEKAAKLTGLSLAGYRFALQPGGLFEQCLVQQKALYTAGVAAHLSEVLPATLRRLATPLISLLDMKTGIVAHLTDGTETIGVLVVTGADLVEADVPAVTALAHQASIALENARLVRVAQSRSAGLEMLAAQILSVQEEERREISLELHDELGQALTGISLDLAAIEREWPAEIAPEIRERLVNASSLLAEMDDRVSDMALDLRPQMLDDLGLLPTLRWHLNRYARQTGLDVSLEVAEFEGQIGPEATTTVYRVVQEALTNVAKYAHASKVTVCLARTGATITAVVEDDGLGFDLGRRADVSLAEVGAGLLGMRERVALLGGAFEIRSQLGQGTRVRIELPARRGGES